MAAAVRERKFAIEGAHAGEIGRKIHEPSAREMDNFAFALIATAHTPIMEVERIARWFASTTFGQIARPPPGRHRRDRRQRRQHSAVADDSMSFTHGKIAVQIGRHNGRAILGECPGRRETDVSPR
ncbi:MULTISPECIES: hypothetical protein [unclassified Shinella]|uniref:hypothetical protein n=1 Tax=unclassified Shinella TaxID=2643062 RepID=UPI00234F2AAE|nr:hypothetical protein [Shinella sp. YE25]MDC7259497.1 hypothetical protein [Shinella sp. YE25]CAK7260910.1 protein of unknown function [Shinella sp. WSC3-e]